MEERRGDGGQGRVCGTWPLERGGGGCLVAGGRIDLTCLMVDGLFDRSQQSALTCNHPTDTRNHHSPASRYLDR